MSTFDAANARFARDAWRRALERTAHIGRPTSPALPLVIDALASQFGTAPALESMDAAMSYRDLANRCGQFARWGLSQGLRGGDSVALMMTNGVEYLAVWLGLTRIGVQVALVNSQLRAAPLLHCLSSIEPKLVIVGAGLVPQVVSSLTPSNRELPLWVLGPAARDFASLDSALGGIPRGPLTDAECLPPRLASNALYIFTSGTTGLPKAAKVSHLRLLRWTHWFAGLMDTAPSDRMYDCLPLYHSVGGVVATGATLLGGGCVVIRDRFSASDFWRDVRDERCTLFQYIGELCRYLVNAPHVPGETEHGLRLACGNGLRADVWEAFQSRFKIPRILEYYASTEGNFSLYNCEGEPGAIGRIPPFLSQRLPVALLRFDVERGEPVRDEAGFCTPAAADEIGEAVGLIAEDSGDAAGRFEGYAEPAATTRKILRSVFAAGDAWYRTGDLMRRDARGFYYFVDRVGETYRWKGENVSTTETLNALLTSRGLVDGVVYGVSVPGSDGRAGLAALVVDSDFDLDAFHADIANGLPKYARPVFLRLLPRLDTTATHKPRKHEMQLQGFDPSTIADPLYFDDPRVGRFVPLDAALYAAIGSGAIRL